MHPWLGTAIVLFLVGLMIAGLIYAMIRDKKRGKGCCGGCTHCKLNCPTRQKVAENGEKSKGNSREMP